MHPPRMLANAELIGVHRESSVFIGIHGGSSSIWIHRVLSVFSVGGVLKDGPGAAASCSLSAIYALSQGHGKRTKQMYVRNR